MGNEAMQATTAAQAMPWMMDKIPSYKFQPASEPRLRAMARSYLGAEESDSPHYSPGKKHLWVLARHGLRSNDMETFMKLAGEGKMQDGK